MRNHKYNAGNPLVCAHWPERVRAERVPLEYVTEQVRRYYAEGATVVEIYGQVQERPEKRERTEI